MESSANDFVSAPLRADAKKRVLRERNTNTDTFGPKKKINSKQKVSCAIKKCSSKDISTTKAIKTAASATKVPSIKRDEHTGPNFSDFDNYSLVISESPPLETYAPIHSPPLDLQPSAADQTKNSATNALTSTPHMGRGSQSDLRKCLLTHLGQRSAAALRARDHSAQQQQGQLCEHHSGSATADVSTGRLPLMSALDASSVIASESSDVIINASVGDARRSLDGLSHMQLSSIVTSPSFSSCR